MSTIKFKQEDKEYVEIQTRINDFNKEYSNYSIITHPEVFELAGNVYAKVQACIQNKEGRVINTGTSMKQKDSNDINKFSFLENAETSAIGRALSFFGIAATNVIASKDEVDDAKESLKQSEKKETVDKGKKLVESASEGLPEVDYSFITTKTPRSEKSLEKMYEGFKNIGLTGSILKLKIKGDLVEFLKNEPKDKIINLL
jgi:hypothetical protein